MTEREARQRDLIEYIGHRCGDANISWGRGFDRSDVAEALRELRSLLAPAPCARCAAVEDAQASMQQRMDTLEEEVLHVESLLRSEEAESGRLLARETALLARASALQNQLNRAGDRIAALTREADTPTQRDESSETLRERIRELEDEVRDLRRVEMLLHEATTTCEAERRGRSPEVKKFLTWMNGMAMGYGKGYLATMEYIESLEALAALARPAPGGTT